jgi:type I restriction enzyme, S subunit
MSAFLPKVSLREAAEPVSRPISPLPGKTYRQLGVSLWGKGAYEREPVDGALTKYQQLFLAERGDIVVNKIWARNGSVAVVDDSLAGCHGSNEFPMFTPIKERLDPRWMHWITKTRDFWAQCDQKSQGTSGQNRIKPEHFLDVEIPLPPLNEQRRIVARIEEFAAKVNEARALRAASRDKLTAILASSTAEIFEKLLGCNTRPLSEAVLLERGKFSHRPRNDPRFFGGAHPWIQIAEIEASEKYVTRWRGTLNDDGLSVSKKFARGTVLISIAATIGAVGILDFDCCIPDSIVGITPPKGIISEFVYYFLIFLRTHLEDIAPQSAQKNINLQILGDIPFPVLSVEKQAEIVSKLDDLQAKFDKINTLQEETCIELDAMLPSILDKAFKGEL